MTNSFQYKLEGAYDQMYFFTSRWTYNWGTYKRQVTVL